MTPPAYPSDEEEADALIEELDRATATMDASWSVGERQRFLRRFGRFLFLTGKMLVGVERGGRGLPLERRPWMAAATYVLRAATVLVVLLVVVVIMIVPLLVFQWQAGVAAFLIAAAIFTTILILAALWFFCISHLGPPGQKRRVLVWELISEFIRITGTLRPQT